MKDMNTLQRFMEKNDYNMSYYGRELSGAAYMLLAQLLEQQEIMETSLSNVQELSKREMATEFYEYYSYSQWCDENNYSELEDFPDEYVDDLVDHYLDKYVNFYVLSNGNYMVFF